MLTSIILRNAYYNAVILRNVLRSKKKISGIVFQRSKSMRLPDKPFQAMLL